MGKYLKTYTGRELLKKHNLFEEGVWKIEGEDPNCDWGGSHSNPYLATVEGTLDKVIEYAIELPQFWTWGGGGKITKINILKVETAKKEANIQLKEKALSKLTKVEKAILGL